MLLIAAKHDHVARRKFVFFPRNHQFHLAKLAGQIFPCPQAVRDPSHLRPWREFHPIEFQPLQIIRQKLPDQHASTLLSGNGIGSIELRLGFRRADQLFHRNLQRGGDFGQHRDRRIGGARFQIRPRGPRHSRESRELFLSQVPALPQLPDVLRDVACNCIVHHSYPFIIPPIHCQTSPYIIRQGV